MTKSVSVVASEWGGDWLEGAWMNFPGWWKDLISWLGWGLYQGTDLYQWICAFDYIKSIPNKTVKQLKFLHAYWFLYCKWKMGGGHRRLCCELGKESWSHCDFTKILVILSMCGISPSADPMLHWIHFTIGYFRFREKRLAIISSSSS